MLRTVLSSTLPQSSLKKLSVNTIPGIEEVNMIKDDGSVIHFNNPKVQASLAANTFAVTGHADNKQITELLPGKAILRLRLLVEATAESDWRSRDDTDQVLEPR